MITETGGGLTVLVLSESDKNWASFATWYSVFKNLPDAKVAVACRRNGDTPFAFFQWAKRLSVPCLKHNPFNTEDPKWDLLATLRRCVDDKLVGGNILALKPFTAVVDVLDQKTLDAMNKGDTWADESAWFIRETAIDPMLEAVAVGDQVDVTGESLCPEAKETEDLRCLVGYRKGCGRWIHTARGCPFSSAGGLSSEVMTANEVRVIELWKKMVALYNAVS